MKKTLEAALVLAVLALGIFIVRVALSRRELAAHPRYANPASGPGEDVEKSGTEENARAGGVKGLPMVRLSRPPKPSRSAAAVPPPLAAP